MDIRKDRIIGRCEALNITITQLMEYLEDDGERPLIGLRTLMNHKIADLAEIWFMEGFYWGHRQSYIAQRDEGEIPATLEFEYGTDLFAPNCERRVTLSSRIRRT